MRRALVTGMVLLATLGAATPAPPPKTVAPIAITIDGTTLPLDPPPRFEKYELLVPVRRIIQALGLDFEKSGKKISTQVGSKTVVLVVGSRRAYVDDQPFQLDMPPVEIKDVLYAPLRFFADVLGAQAYFDAKARIVHIDSSTIGQTGDGKIVRGKHIEYDGIVTAVDIDSDPPTITVSYGPSVRTIEVGTNALIDLHDVNTDVYTPGELGNVRPGDFARIGMDRSGQASHITDAFGSRSGLVAAVTGSDLVLDDGQVIEPSRGTMIELNAATATLADIHVGDRATVRYNIETNEVREILASRASSAPSSANGIASIDSVTLDATRPLRANQSVTFTLRGTSDAVVTFDIGSYVSGLVSSQTSPGVYTTVFHIPNDANFADVPVIGRLTVRGGPSVTQASTQTLSAASAPPGIADVAPAAGATIDSAAPAIYVTFATDAVDVDPSSIRLEVNGRDVTPESLRSARYIEYLPRVSYPDGKVRVSVHVADLAGNVSEKSWSFTIKTR